MPSDDASTPTRSRRSAGPSRAPRIASGSVHLANRHTLGVDDANAGWDRELLGLELQYLTDLDVDFDVTLTGFELPEIDLLIGELSLAGDNDPADAAVEVSAGPPSPGRATFGASAAIG